MKVKAKDLKVGDRLIDDVGYMYKFTERTVEEIIKTKSKKLIVLYSELVTYTGEDKRRKPYFNRGLLYGMFKRNDEISLYEIKPLRIINMLT